MKTAASIQFHDEISADEAWVGVRYDGRSIGLVVSLKQNGDVESLMAKTQVQELIKALEQACSELDQPESVR